MYECIRVYTNAFIHDIVHIIHIDVTIYIYESIINTYIYITHILHTSTHDASVHIGKAETRTLRPALELA